MVAIPATLLLVFVCDDFRALSALFVCSFVRSLLLCSCDIFPTLSCLDSSLCWCHVFPTLSFLDSLSCSCDVFQTLSFLDVFPTLSFLVFAVLVSRFSSVILS